MSTDRDTTRIVRSWLDEGVTQLPDRVLDAVLDQVPATPQRRAGWLARRFPIMNNNVVRFGIAAVAVVVIAVVGIQLFGGPGPNVGGPGATETPQPTSTPASTPEPTAPEPTAGPLAEGPFVLVYEMLFGVRATVTIPAPDWHGLQYRLSLEKHGIAGPPQGAELVVYGGDMFVYGDPCAWESTRPDNPAASLDELVAALSAQASRDAAPPENVTVGGHPGKKLTLHVPEDAVFTGCDGGEFRTLMEVSSSGDEAPRSHPGPGQINEVWVVDVDGTLVFFDAGYFADTPAEDVEEMRAIVESATFGAP